MEWPPPDLVSVEAAYQQVSPTKTAPSRFSSGSLTCGATLCYLQHPVGGASAVLYDKEEHKHSACLLRASLVRHPGNNKHSPRLENATYRTQSCCRGSTPYVVAVESAPTLYTTAAVAAARTAPPTTPPVEETESSGNPSLSKRNPHCSVCTWSGFAEHEQTDLFLRSSPPPPSNDPGMIRPRPVPDAWISRSSSVDVGPSVPEKTERPCPPRCFSYEEPVRASRRA